MNQRHLWVKVGLPSLLIDIYPRKFLVFASCFMFHLLFLFFAGQLLLAKGDLDQSSDVFKIVLDGRPDSVPALLGQVNCCAFSIMLK